MFYHTKQEKAGRTGLERKDRTELKSGIEVATATSIIFTNIGYVYTQLSTVQCRLYVRLQMKTNNFISYSILSPFFLTFHRPNMTFLSSLIKFFYM